MADLFREVIPNVVGKKNYEQYKDDTSIEPFILNRALAMNSSFLPYCNHINRWFPKEIWKRLIWYYIPKNPKASTRWISKKKDDLEWFYRKAAKFHNCSLRSLAGSKELLIAQKELYADLVGLSDTERKKLGLEVKKVTIEKLKKEKPKGELQRWFN